MVDVWATAAGPARTSERVKDLLADCLREMQPYGVEAEPLREIARYVALRTNGDAARDGEVVRPDEQPLRAGPVAW